MAAIDDQPPTPGHQRLADQLGRIQHITAALAAARTEEAIGDVIVDVVVPALGADGGAVYDIDAQIPLTEAARTGQPVSFSSPEDRLHRFPGATHVRFPYQS